MPTQKARPRRELIKFNYLELSLLCKAAYLGRGKMDYPEGITNTPYDSMSELEYDETFNSALEKLSELRDRMAPSKIQ